MYTAAMSSNFRCILASKKQSFYPNNLMKFEHSLEDYISHYCMNV